MKVTAKEVICTCTASRDNIITCTASGFPCHCPSASYDKLVKYGVVRCKKDIKACDKQKVVDAKKQKQKWIKECGGNIEK